MNLVRASGAYDRANIIARAREIYAGGGSWNDALLTAYWEASKERDRLFGRPAISAVKEREHA